jgi:hypothetical protein
VARDLAGTGLGKSQHLCAEGGYGTVAPVKAPMCTSSEVPRRLLPCNITSHARRCAYFAWNLRSLRRVVPRLHLCKIGSRSVVLNVGKRKLRILRVS